MTSQPKRPLRPEQVKKLLHEAERRVKASGPPEYLETLFGLQRDFVLDSSRYKCALTGRRAGKTTACAVYLLVTALSKPKHHAVYIALTRQNAKDFVWYDLIEYNDKYRLGIRFNNSELNAYCPNGSVIRLRGADDMRKIERLRGYKFALAIVDESQSYANSVLVKLIDSILDYTLGDMRGTLCLTGTPGPVLSGLFWEVSTGHGEREKYSTHSWMVLQNPHFPNPQGWIDEQCRKRGLSAKSPTYQREMLGRWVEDLDSLVYHYDPRRNAADSLPSGRDWSYVLGIDIGVTDSSAFCVLAYDTSQPDIYVVDAWKAPGYTPSRLAAKVEEYQQKWNFSSIVVDTGGIGKGYVEEFRQHHGIPAKPAQKRNKRAYIEHYNDALVSGRMKYVMPVARPLLDEQMMLQWDEERKLPDDRYEDHLCDAALYAYREVRSHYDPELNAPKHGTDEYWKTFEADLERQNSSFDDGEPWWAGL